MINPWINIDKPNNDFNVRLVGESHPLMLYWGRDTQGRYLFIFDTATSDIPEKKHLPKLSGVTAAIATAGSNSKLFLILNETSNWELFHALCSDLVRATSSGVDSQAAAVIFLRRLTRWQDFLKRERSGILQVEAIKGLIGELLFLSERIVPNFGWDDAISFWKGPEDAPQDFAVHDTAIEVKCQSGGSKPSVHITSVEQLEPQLPNGFLAVYTLSSADKEDASGFNLNSLVTQIRNQLAGATESARERFEDLIFMAGYIYSEEYDRYRYAKIALRSYRIEEGFPRIRISNISAGIERVTYTLKLEACSPFEGKPNW